VGAKFLIAGLFSHHVTRWKGASPCRTERGSPAREIGHYTGDC
jgi:hypothetical protein